MNAAWKIDPHYNGHDVVGFAINDDGWLMCTTDGTKAEQDFAKVP